MPDESHVNQFAEPGVEVLLSLNRLCRHLIIPYSQAIQLHTKGVIKPDFLADRNYFFRKQRLPELMAAVNGALGSETYIDPNTNIIERRPKK